METEKIYLEYLDSNKKTGYILGIFDLPLVRPLNFIVATILISALLQYALPMYHLHAIFTLIFCFDYGVIMLMRNRVLDTCISEEIYFAMCLERDGGDPHFPKDPAHVTDNDRHYIFVDAMGEVRKTNFLKKLKSHYVYFISIVALYVLSYLSIQFIMHSIGY
jgi:hypothetical protein